jgi:hypothetical protein
MQLLMSKPKAIEVDMAEQDMHTKLLRRDPVMAKNLPQPNFQLTIEYCSAKNEYNNAMADGPMFTHHAQATSYFEGGVLFGRQASLLQEMWDWPYKSKLADRVYAEYLLDRVHGCLQVLSDNLLLGDIVHPDISKLSGMAPERLYFCLSKAEPNHLRKATLAQLEPAPGSKEKVNPTLAFRNSEEFPHMPAFRTCQTLLMLIPNEIIDLGPFQVKDGSGMRARDAITLLMMYSETRSLLTYAATFHSLLMVKEYPLPFVRSLDDSLTKELVTVSNKLKEHAVQLTDVVIARIEDNDSLLLLNAVATMRIWTEGAQIFIDKCILELKLLWSSGLQACGASVNDVPRCDMYITETEYDIPTVLNACLTRSKIEFTEKTVRIIAVAISKVEKLAILLGVQVPGDDPIMGAYYKEALTKYAYGKKMQGTIKALNLIINHGKKPSSKGPNGGASLLIDYVNGLSVQIPAILMKELSDMKADVSEKEKTKVKAIEDVDQSMGIPGKLVPLAALRPNAKVADKPYVSPGSKAKCLASPSGKATLKRSGRKLCKFFNSRVANNQEALWQPRSPRLQGPALNKSYMVSTQSIPN